MDDRCVCMNDDEYIHEYNLRKMIVEQTLFLNHQVITKAKPFITKHRNNI